MFDQLRQWVPRSRGALALLALAGVSAVAAACALWVTRDDWWTGVTRLAGTAWTALQGTPAVVYFSAQAFFPAVGAPISPFYFAAGSIYGLPVSLAGSALALVVSLSLGYWLARGLARPLVEYWVKRAGLSTPEVSPANQLRVTLLLRVTPGIPFVLQNFILGLSGIPFRIYLLVSWPLQYAWAVAFLTLGESAIEGEVGQLLFALGLIVALVIITRIFRSRARRKAGESESGSGRESESESGGGVAGSAE